MEVPFVTGVEGNVLGLGLEQNYAETNKRINRLAHALGKMGIQKGDCVGILHVNYPQYVEGYFAVTRLNGKM